jgi:hypothetical protein
VAAAVKANDVMRINEREFLTHLTLSMSEWADGLELTAADEIRRRYHYPYMFDEDYML